MKTREELLAEARRIRGNITEMFQAAAAHNRAAKVAGVETINPDPDGQVGRLAASLDAFIADAERQGPGPCTPAPCGEEDPDA